MSLIAWQSEFPVCAGSLKAETISSALASPANGFKVLSALQASVVDHSFRRSVDC